MNNKEQLFEQLANQVMFGGMTESRLLEKFQYRKNKTIKDVKNAIQRGLNQGCGKTEYELQFISICLQTVLIIKKETK